MTEQATHPEGGQPVIVLDALERIYPGPAPVHAVRPVDLVIGQGDFAAIVGPSGSGKSTLLNVLGLLDSPTAGRYLLDGIDTGPLRPAQRAALRGSKIGFVFQSFHLLANRTALDNVALAGTYAKTPRKIRLARAAEAIEMVGLSHRAGFMPSVMSGGERQRLAIARALACRPAVLLCDEPTGNLDTERSEEILALFEQMNAAGFTIVIVTHDEQLAARAHRRIEVRDGNVRDLPTSEPPCTGPVEAGSQ
ncbi:ABC transporter ATP-binding protein [Nocardioides yefusunii]|uniref:ABC transporter ATP-binding protein n=1 Tax=Nocardioides yefusunii TaxID=2500546 RepID=A0ABW1QYT0_9ACTN|nr:ABC transporter ATP-binding protein [Nocardioides yefusunii]